MLITSEHRTAIANVIQNHGPTRAHQLVAEAGRKGQQNELSMVVDALGASRCFHLVLELSQSIRLSAGGCCG